MPTPPTGVITWAASPITSRPGPVPALDAPGLDRQERDLVPVLEGIDPIGELGGQLDDRLAERRQAGIVDLLVATLRDDVGDLPFVATVQDRHHVAA